MSEKNHMTLKKWYSGGHDTTMLNVNVVDDGDVLNRQAE
jgi:hypothetical protein